MAQFYFLAVLLNIVCGLICVYNHENVDDDFDDEDKKSLPGIDKIQEGIAGESLFTNPTFNLVAGALCLVTGLVILFAPYKGPSVIGDLLPAVTALCCGASVLVSYLENKSDEFVPPEIVDTIFIENKLYIGIAALLFGILHFIAPGAPIL